MRFPWQEEQWRQLCRLQQEQRLPHALAFIGQAGLGKYELAQAFATRVLCLQPPKDESACGHCHACQLMAAKSHPDYCLITPEEEGHAIKVDQIRELGEFIQKTSHQGGYRLVLIQPASAMNLAAANALLKTLEEPTPRTLLILISDQKTSLPLTILSRCQQLRFAAPATQEGLAWLEAQDAATAWPAILAATQGAPLQALRWKEQGIWPLYQNFMRDLTALSQQAAHPLELALQWKETNMLWVFDMFFQWLIKLLRLQQKVSTEESEVDAALPSHISALNLLEFADYLQRLRAEALGPFNLNQQLLLESLFIRWAQYAAC